MSVTPIEALVQIVQSAELNPAESVNGLAAIARVALRESGEHGLLFVHYGVDIQTINCYCGWQLVRGGVLVPAAELIAEHAKTVEVAA